MGRDRTSAPQRPRRVDRASLSAGFLVRIVVLACAAVAGSAWGLVRFYTRARAPMVVTAPGGDRRDAGAWDAGPGTVEIEVEGR